MTNAPRFPALATRLRRLLGAATLACVTVTATATAARADGTPARSGSRTVASRLATRARTEPKSTAKAKSTKVKPTTKPATKAKSAAATRSRSKAAAPRLSARERTKARSVAAAKHTRSSDLHLESLSTAAVVEHEPSALDAAVAVREEELRDSVVRMARAQIGVPYVLGGTTPDGFDCSGLVKYVMDALHVRLPRTAAEQAQVGARVERDPSRLRPGDLLTFASRGEGVSHIGIYVGNGRMIHASTTAGRVIETALIRPAYPTIKPWRGARRVVAASAALPSDSSRQ